MVCLFDEVVLVDEVISEPPHVASQIQRLRL